ncbi:MAG: choice-of-anchor I family protein [Pseudomonadota bacterium]
MFLQKNPKTKAGWKLSTALAAGAFLLLSACSDDDDDPAPAPPVAPPPPVTMVPEVTLESIGVFETGIFDEGAAEIVAFDPSTDRLFVVNSNDTTVDVLDMTDPTAPSLVDQIDASALGAGANSVAVSNGLVAVAIEADDATDPGLIAFFDSSSLALDGTVTVGALPDMVTFTPDGQTVLVANEGEVSDDLQTNPAGTISIIDISGGVATAVADTADFLGFNDDAADLAAAGIRLNQPDFSGVADPLTVDVSTLPQVTVAQDLEPEFIAVAPDGETAFISLQENNGLAILDIDQANITSIVSFGTVDHSLAGNEFDPNDDDGINIVNGPVQGFRMPDSIVAFDIGGEVFIATANEGDGREFEVEDPATGDDEVVFTDVIDVDDGIDDGVFDASLDAAALTALNDLEVSLTDGDTDGDGDIDEIFAFGSRSFSIFDASGTLVFDSGSMFETITADMFPDDFNSDNDENDSFEARSDDAGPEPEGIEVGVVDGVTLAFIGLERIGGIMVYDISDPANAVFETYLNIRDFSVDAQLPDDSTNPAVGDLGPEGLDFISADNSPTGVPLLAVGNEVSGTTRIFQVNLEMVPES